MYSFKASSVSEALSKGLQYLLREGIEEQTRNGPALVSPGPVCTEYLSPHNRVLYSATRDANPFFHCMEALWMLAGENDITFPCYFLKNYAAYSDDGRTMWDAYGWRWRRFFGWDQLVHIAQELRENPGSRRCVLSMWSAMPIADHWDSDTHPYSFYDSDLHVAAQGGKAVPCNTHAYFDLRGGRLNITVCNRSNDVLWGCYGANVVQFSFLQEYVATQLEVPVGVYRQFSNNYHVYLGRYNREWMDRVAFEADTTLEERTSAHLVGGPHFDEDLRVFMTWTLQCIVNDIPGQPGLGTLRCLDVPSLQDKFLCDVAVPMFLAWHYRKLGWSHAAWTCVDGIEAPDWRRACREWMERREASK